eukprot:3441391-Pyramimonas_sp.AAC.1
MEGAQVRRGGLSPRPLCATVAQEHQAWHFVDTKGGAQGVVAHRGRYARRSSRAQQASHLLDTIGGAPGV